MLPIDIIKEYSKYQSMGVNRRIAVDNAFKAAVKALQDNGIHKTDCAMDNRAEELIAAIAC